jgi:hypothetical protein
MISAKEHGPIGCAKRCKVEIDDHNAKGNEILEGNLIQTKAKIYAHYS